MSSNGNGAHSTATVEPPSSFLEKKHVEHLASEGFTDAQILELQKQGVRSLSVSEAEKLGFKVKTKSGLKSGSGLYLPFCDNFAQLRLDEPVQRENGQIAKYLTPVGARSQAFIPEGCQVITEGVKDAHAGSVHGEIPTGALAGVSHFRKALKEGAGYTVLFDSDGWHNPSVFSNLFHAGKYLKGKIQLVPEIPGEPKGGLCEYFKAGYTASDYTALIKSAMKPEAFLLAWPAHFGKIPAEKLSLALRTAFRLAAEYLNEIETGVLLNGIRKATKLSVALLKAELEKQKRIVANKLRTQERKSFDCGEHELDGQSPPILEAPKPSKSKQAIERRANQLLDSGVLFDLVKILVDKSGAVGIGDHVQVALASTIGTFRLDRRRSMPTLFTGSSGIGKSMVLDTLESLLPHGSSIRVSGVSDAVLKRIGDAWRGKIITIDEFSTWATSDTVLSTLKELISRGEASFEIAVPGKEGWDIERFDVSGPIGIAACATEASIATIFGDSEEEIRSRFNEIPLPEDIDYIKRISRAAFCGLEPENLAEKYPGILGIIHRAIEIVLSRKVPKCDPLLEDALFHHVQPDRPLFPRLLKRLKILLENTSALLGKTAIDLETYATVFPLIAKVFRRSLTSENDATLAQFAQLGTEIKDAIAGGYLPFKIPKIQDCLSCSKTQAYRLRDKWDSLGWIESTAYATYAATPKGIEILKRVGGDNPGLPEMLPPVEKLAATMQKLAESRGLETVFPYLNSSSSMPSGDFIPTFSQVFPRFSQASKKGETLINNRVEIDSSGEFSQIPKLERDLSQKNTTQSPELSSSSPNGSSIVFSEGSLIPGNLGKLEGKNEKNSTIPMVSADGNLGKTLGKPEKNRESLGNSQNTVPVLSETAVMGSAIAPEATSVPNPFEVDLGSTEPICLPNAQNFDTLSDVAVDPPSTLGISESTLETSEAPTSAVAIALPPADPVSLNIGDAVRHKSGSVKRITKFIAGGWLADDGLHISRDDLKAKTYVKATLPSPAISDPDPAESASILIDFADGIDAIEMVQDLAKNWTEAHKKEVWKRLTPDLQEKYRKLRDAAT